MENQEIDFALSFMLDHPVSAVKVLEQSDVEKVAVFFQQLPEHYITPVLACMLPEFAGKLAVNLPTTRAAAMLENIDLSTAANILRRISPQHRPAILHELPRRLRHSIELLLTYSTRSLGAWISPHCLTQPPETALGDVLHYLKNESSFPPDSQYLYAVDREGNLHGKTAVMSILKSAGTMPLSAILDKRNQSLPANMLLEQAVSHRAWQDADSLPVVSRTQEFLGIITHSALRQGLASLSGDKSPISNAKDPVANLFEAYGQSLLAALNTVSEAIDHDTNP